MGYVDARPRPDSFDEKTSRSAMADVEPAEAVRAFGNRTTVRLVTLFPTDWLEKAWTIITPSDQLVLAVDVNDNPAGASIMSGHITEDGQGGGTADRMAGRHPDMGTRQSGRDHPGPARWKPSQRIWGAG